MPLSNKKLGEYLKSLRENLNYSTYDVNRLCDVSQSYLSLIENGNRRASAIVLKKLARVYRVNYIDLYEKAGYIDLLEDIKEKENSRYIIPKSIPVLGKISAGVPLYADEQLEGYMLAPESVLNEDYDYFYLRVSGDSMNLKFDDGDLVLIQKQSTLENGEIGAIRVNGFDATIKRFKKEGNLIVLEPMSTNTKHAVQIYNPKEIEIEIIGKAIWKTGKI